MSCGYLNLGQLISNDKDIKKASMSSNINSSSYKRTEYDQNMINEFNQRNKENYEPSPIPMSVGVVDTDSSFQRTAYDADMIKRFGSC